MGFGFFQVALLGDWLPVGGRWDVHMESVAGLEEVSVGGHRAHGIVRVNGDWSRRVGHAIAHRRRCRHGHSGEGQEGPRTLWRHLANVHRVHRRRQRRVVVWKELSNSKPMEVLLDGPGSGLAVGVSWVSSSLDPSLLSVFSVAESLTSLFTAMGNPRTVSLSVVVMNSDPFSLSTISRTGLART